MKFVKNVLAVIGVLAIAGCSSAQFSKGVDIANAVSKDECRVLVWGQPVIKKLSDSGVLDPNGQAVLADVNTVLAAGCDSGDVTALARAGDVMKAMIAIIYAPHP